MIFSGTRESCEESLVNACSRLARARIGNFIFIFVLAFARSRVYSSEMRARLILLPRLEFGQSMFRGEYYCFQENARVFFSLGLFAELTIVRGLFRAKIKECFRINTRTLVSRVKFLKIPLLR